MVTSPFAPERDAHDHLVHKPLAHEAIGGEPIGPEAITSAGMSAEAVEEPGGRVR